VISAFRNRRHRLDLAESDFNMSATAAMNSKFLSETKNCDFDHRNNFKTKFQMESIALLSAIQETTVKLFFSYLLELNAN
jgi:hypothetical protein